MLAANLYGEVDTCVHSTPFGRCLLKREERETESGKVREERQTFLYRTCAMGKRL